MNLKFISIKQTYCYSIVLFLLFLLSACGQRTEKILPYGDMGDKWELNEQFSDEFNADEIDLSKWTNDVNDWGPWSWRTDNVFQRDGYLNVQMVYEPHSSRDMEMFYKSGILKSLEPVQYGYFEARIKGCERFPGVCPAFWMKGSEGGLSSEVDFVETQQSPDFLNRIDFALHARDKVDGQTGWIRETRNWTAPWDPREDFHIYACEVTPDSIKWFVDGELMVETDNRHWHIPSYIMFSMGLRRPLFFKEMVADPEEPGGYSRIRLPNPETSSPEGFPTAMLVDYIRVFNKAEE